MGEGRVFTFLFTRKHNSHNDNDVILTATSESQVGRGAAEASENFVKAPFEREELSLKISTSLEA